MSDAPEAASGELRIEEIVRLIPHRFPLLLVDRVTECVPNKRIAGYKNITRGEAFFRPAEAAMPHVLIVEALAQVSVILALKSLNLEPSSRELMFFGGINKARFEGDVVAGQRLDLVSEVTRFRRMMGWFSAAASVEGRTIVTVEMLAAIRPGS